MSDTITRLQRALDEVQLDISENLARVPMTPKLREAYRRNVKREREILLALEQEEAVK